MSLFKCKVCQEISTRDAWNQAGMARWGGLFVDIADIKQREESAHRCPKCGSIVNDGRIEILPDIQSNEQGKILLKGCEMFGTL